MILQTDKHVFQLEGLTDRFHASMTYKQPQQGIHIVKIKLEAGQKEKPSAVTLKWTHPISDIHCYWNPKLDRNDNLIPDWRAGFKSNATISAPVGCLYNLSGMNRMAFAFSDALNLVDVRIGVNEESALFHNSITLFEEPTAPFETYEASLWIDTRNIPYYDSLQDIQRWWSELPGYKPASVPEDAKLPMYSTWYSFHQTFTPEEVEEQCRLAKTLGCDSVIVDDGWQTADNQRGYAYCGDWEVCTDKIPDMKAHVDRVHDLGMKYILWYSVPFIGKHTKAWDLFKDKMLYVIDHLGAGVIDPRYPEIREYLIDIYEKAVRSWGLDGLKLDFVDRIRIMEEDRYEPGDGRDIASVPEAVDRLMTDIINRLKAIKPDIMIEFRQNYIGPLMRKYGNMFRAADCPNDAIENRTRTLDLRLISGDTAVHADMLMWNLNEPVESAALQIVNVLFSVPQISVLLDKLPEDHLKMVRYWLSFWREHRDVLLDGKIEPYHSELFYPSVLSSTNNKRVAAVYHDTVINPGRDIPDLLMIVNGTLQSRVIMELNEDLNDVNLTISSCQGDVVQTERLVLLKGVHRLSVPPAGLITIAKTKA